MAPKAIADESTTATVTGSLSGSADDIKVQPLETQTQLEQSQVEKSERKTQSGGASARQSSMSATGSLDDTKQLWP